MRVPVIVVGGNREHLPSSAPPRSQQVSQKEISNQTYLKLFLAASSMQNSSVKGIMEGLVQTIVAESLDRMKRNLVRDGALPN